MDWFKNLNAAPRLLLSFGLLIVLIAAISCLAIVNLSQANDRIMALYQKDMAGLGVADELAIARLSLGRVGRDAILNMRDAAVVTADDKEILSALSDHSRQPRPGGQTLLCEGGYCAHCHHTRSLTWVREVLSIAD